MLTDHLTLRELTRSDVATRRSILNLPPPSAVENLRALCAFVLEPLREHLNSAIMITSGYRSLELNRLIGGSPTSQHCLGEAVDLEVDGLDNLQAARAIADSGLPFDQLILECYSPGEPSSGWLHLSHRSRLERGANRCQVLTAVRRGGAWSFDPGLPR